MRPSRVLTPVLRVARVPASIYKVYKVYKKIDLYYSEIMSDQHS